MIKKIIKFSIFFSFFIIASCKKNEKELGNLKLIDQEKLEVHNQQVNAWLKMFQVNEQIKANTLKVFKTVYEKEQFITKMQIGEQGRSLYFISEKNKFNTYGINSELKDGKTSGLVEIFDFQKMGKRGLKFKQGRLTSILTYPSEQHFNPNSSSSQSNNPTSRTASFIGGIRKFFCELFGGVWLSSIAENASSSGGSCYTGSNGEGQVESVLNDDGGGGSGFNWGPIFTNINNPSFFENSNSSFWLNYLNNPNVGGGGGSGTGTSSIPALTFEQKRDFLITSLNLNQTQEFYLINTDNAVTSEFEFLMTNSGINKIEVAVYAIDYISTNLNIPFTTIAGWFFTNPNPDTQLIYLLDFINNNIGQTNLDNPDINTGGVHDNIVNSTGPGISEATKKHVLKGEINSQGKAVGFHFYKNNGITARIKEGAKQNKVGPAELGMFKAKVEVKTTDPNNPWKEKDDPSTFFPPKWNEDKVLAAIQSAFDNRTRDDPNKNRYTGTYTDPDTGITIQIQLFLKSNNEIITAFPKY